MAGRRRGWWNRRDRIEWFKKHKPREAKGGIKAQSRRGAIGASWQARRFLEALASAYNASRLARGRAYARKGQVVALEIDGGAVRARVQGSRPDPYEVEIRLAPLAPAALARVAAALAGQALFAAKLLAGELPPEIEAVFAAADAPLFPSRAADFHSTCSCPDSWNPCKHISAVFYLLAEELDRDPALLFRLRGIPLPSSPSPAPAPAPARDPAPLSPDPAAFWSSPSPLPDDLTGPAVAASAAPLLRRLGSFPFWRGTERFLDALAPIYERAAARGLDFLA